LKKCFIENIPYLRIVQGSHKKNLADPLLATVKMQKILSFSREENTASLNYVRYFSSFHLRTFPTWEEKYNRTSKYFFTLTLKDKISS